MSVSAKEYHQLRALFQRCAMAEDLDILKYELYCYDPEKYFYFSPVAEPQMHISMLDLATTFWPLFNKLLESRKSAGNEG